MSLTLAEIREQLTGPGQLLEIVEVDIEGHPTRVWKNAPPTLRSVVEMSRLHGDKVFVVYEDERLTFAQHADRVAALARRLVDDHGLAKGDRVAIAMRNYPEWIIAFWATVSVGAIAVPLNAWWTGAELAYALSDSASRILICDAERHQRLRPLFPTLDLDAVIVARPDGPTEGARTFDEALGSVTAGAALPEAEIGPDDDATIFYTSGTTGRPKGALGTHRNMCTGVMTLAWGAISSSLRRGGSGGDLGALATEASQQASMLSVPLFHVTGCHAFMLGAFAYGAKLVMMHRWDPERALELIERERITTFGGVPAMVWQVLQSPDLARRDVSSVRNIGYGGAPAPPELVRRIEELLPGRRPTNGWGMTETSASATSNTGDDYLARPDSVGPPLPVCDIRIVDEAGVDVPAGQTGELLVRGPNVVKGYWRNAEATAESFSDGWLRTGDIARVDEDGFVYIVDRAKDMVIRGGENVYGVEVESALFEHPAVYDCAVLGIPHPVLGEEVGAVIQRRPGAEVDEDEVREFLAERLAAFKIPTRIWISDDLLPRNAAGKVLKRELRDAVIAP